MNLLQQRAETYGFRFQLLNKLLAETDEAREKVRNSLFDHRYRQCCNKCATKKTWHCREGQSLMDKQSQLLRKSDVIRKIKGVLWRNLCKSSKILLKVMYLTS